MKPPAPWFIRRRPRKSPFEEVRASCPYDIPRQAKDGRIVKCTMCIDRVSNGLVPACVKVCPTGTMNFGERDAMLNLANERLAKLKGKYPKAQLLDADQIRVVFLVVDDPAKYHKFAVASADIGRQPQTGPAAHAETGCRTVSRSESGMTRCPFSELRVGCS